MASTAQQYATSIVSPVPGSEPSPVTFTCHCRRVSVTIPSPPQRLMECTCSICYRYGVLWAYFYRGDVTITGETQPYLRGDEDAGGDLAFHRCSQCGCVTHWIGVKDTARRKRLGPEAKMGVNCRMLPKEAIEGVERIVSKR